MRKSLPAFASIADPVVASGAVFLLQGSVLLTSNKQEFAVFSLAYSYVLVGQAILNAVFGPPMLTVLARKSAPKEKAELGEAFLKRLLIGAVLIAIIATLVGWMFGVGLEIAAICSVTFLALSFRDALRTAMVSQLRVYRALIIAVVMATLTAASLATLVFVADVDVGASYALLILASSTLIAVSLDLARASLSTAPLPSEAFKQLRDMAAWSVPGAIVIWLQNSFYLTLIALSIDMQAVGEVSAARLLILPILIAATGAMRYWQVRAAQLIETLGLDAAITVAWRLITFAVAAGVILLVSVTAARNLVSPEFLPADYPNILDISLAWALFAIAVVARSILSALYQAIGRYKDIFRYNLIALPIVLAGIVIAPNWFGLIGAVLPMVAGEILLGSILALKLRNSTINP